MIKKTIIFFLFITSVSLFHGEWVYTPKTGKWTNPKYKAKETPREQLMHGQKFEEEGNYDRAAREYKKLIKTFPTSELVPDALFKSAECYEKDHSYYNAYLMYQELIDKYPGYKDFTDIVSRQFKIANLFMSGKKKKLWKVPILSSRDEAIEIFNKVIENLPYSELAVESIYNIGLIHENKKEYEEAIQEYERILAEYNESTFVDDAYFRRAECLFKESYGAEYDKSSARKSLKYYREFVTRFPDSEFVNLARKKIIELETREAQGAYEIGLYYERNKDYQAAKVYYNDIITEFSEAKIAAKARERLKKIEKLVVKKEQKIAAYEEKNEPKRIYRDALKYEKMKDYYSAEIFYLDVLLKYPDSKYAKKAEKKIKRLKKRTKKIKKRESRGRNEEL